MREIEYRAKAKNSGRWVYGDLVTNKYKSRQGVHIYEKSNNINCLSGYQFVRIDKNTIGQYIGLKDKNGKKIFEGDIVKEQYGGMKEIKFGRIGWDSGVGLTGFVCVNDLEDTLENDGDEEFYSCDRCVELKELEIVGNVFDNPELLEEV